MCAETKKQVPVMEGLFPWPPTNHRLIGNKCKKCGQHYFPVTFRCQDPDCMGDEMEDVLLSPEGTLWSYTVVHYQLPPPFQAPKEGFKPFGVGEVEFPEGVRVAGIVTGADAEKDLKIDMKMKVVLDKLYEDEQGNDVIGWKFAPAK
ncbi:MAG: OB-fold domain-containing protein [Chloroflexota bacterium]